MPRRAPRPALARTQRASKPCRVCNNLDPRSHPATFHDAESTSRSIARLTLGVDALALRRSQGNCSRCRLLADALDAHEKNRPTSKPRLLLELVEHAPIQLVVHHGQPESVKLEIYAPEDKPSPWPTLGHARSIPVHPDSAESFEFARKAIGDCIKNHQPLLCGQSRRDIFVPSRLIYVGKEPGSYDHIKLCQLPVNVVRYIALSHCWGHGPTFTLTTATLEERRKRIDYRSLPKLFQEAITIAQELGVRYLWIDALCIIQDSKEDWEMESAKMSSIYENAHVTIAATSANSNDCRMFTERPRAVKLKHQANPRAKTYKVCVREMPDHHPSTGEHRSPARPNGPLCFRAWALQEHVLCSRILHYTAHELLFECRLAYRCECAPSPKRVLTTPGLLPELLTTGKKGAYWKTWHRIVAQYTARDLTVPSDKLPAISGIAKKFRDPMRSAYLAGLWRDNLTEDLLWSSDRSLQSPHRARRLDAYRAPSFSWASVDTQVQYHERDDAGEEAAIMPVIAVREARVRFSGKNTLGAVDDGWIRLKGPVLEARLIAPEGEGFAYHLFRSGHSSIDVAPDSLLVVDDVVTPSDQPQTQTQNMARQVTVRRARPAESYAPFKATVLCLAIARHDDACISGIVLGASTRTSDFDFGGGEGKDAACYERLGAFSCGDEWFSGAAKRELVLV